MLFAVELPRVSQSSAVPSAVDTQLPLHTLLERDVASILGSPACWLCLSFLIQTRPERNTGLRLGGLHYRESREPAQECWTSHIHP